MTTGQLLKKLREEKGWSIPHYAKLRKVSSSNIRAYELELYHPKPKRLKHLLKSFRLTIPQFIEMLKKETIYECIEKEEEYSCEIFDE